MTILVFGKTGQVSTELQRQATVTALGRKDVNLEIPEGCADAIRSIKPTAVINAAAYTAVDQAEDEEDTAAKINAQAPCVMAQTCADLDIPFVHISTDYVFDGTGDQPWKPSDPTSPLGAYGRTKLAGEQGIIATGGQYAILRTSWVFSAHGNNFVKTMLRLAETRDHLTIVADQVGGPTSAVDIARTCLNICNQMLNGVKSQGVYHFSGAPFVSWADFARAIFTQAGLNVSVEDIPSSAYPTKATRPLNSRLECADLKQDFAIAQPDWKDSLAFVLKQLKEQTQ